TSFATDRNDDVSLTFDPSRGHLVLVDNMVGQMYQRVAGEWQAIEVPVPCGNAVGRPLYYDAVRARLTLLSSDATQVCRWSNGWQPSSAGMSARVAGASYDVAHGAFVLLHNPGPDDSTTTMDV